MWAGESSLYSPYIASHYEYFWSYIWRVALKSLRIWLSLQRVNERFVWVLWPAIRTEILSTKQQNHAFPAFHHQTALNTNPCVFDTRTLLSLAENARYKTGNMTKTLQQHKGRKKLGEQTIAWPRLQWAYYWTTRDRYETNRIDDIITTLLPNRLGSLPAYIVQHQLFYI